MLEAAVIALRDLKKKKKKAKQLFCVHVAAALRDT